MVATPTVEKLAKQKLQAFELLQPEFEASFYFVQEVHGQRRFSTFPVMQIVLSVMKVGIALVSYNAG